MSKARILIVEDKFLVAQDLSVCLRKLGYTVSGICASGNEALEQARQHQPQLVLMDIRLKGNMDGIDTVHQLRKEMEVPVVFLTAHSDEDTLQRASEAEPSGYVLKPFDERQLFTTIELALNRPRQQRSAFLAENPQVLVETAQKSQVPETVQPLVQTLREKKEFAGIVGHHPKILQLLNNIDLVAKTDVTVHIHGENGTGKELIADALHHLSPRRNSPFIKINCSAIPANLLESALFGHCKGAFTGATKDQQGFVERGRCVAGHSGKASPYAPNPGLQPGR
jgi:DNA-binding NtrC family response regulator